MASKSHREDSRWRLSPLGRIQDGVGDVIEDDIIQDGGVMYSQYEGVGGVNISSQPPLGECNVYLYVHVTHMTS